jgi:hypothetical protein
MALDPGDEGLGTIRPDEVADRAIEGDHNQEREGIVTSTNDIAQQRALNPAEQLPN